MLIDWKADSLHYKRRVEENTKKIHYRCPICKGKGTCTRHGYYIRHIICWRGQLVEQQLRILRVVCSECFRTHAVLPRDVIPHRIYTVSYYWKMIRVIYTMRQKISWCAVFFQTSLNQIYGMLHRQKEILTRLRDQLRRMLTYMRLTKVLNYSKIRQIQYYTTLIVNS